MQKERDIFESDFDFLDDLEESLNDGLILCYNYQESQYRLSVDIYINDDKYVAECTEYFTKSPFQDLETGLYHEREIGEYLFEKNSLYELLEKLKEEHLIRYSLHKTLEAQNAISI